MLSAHLMFKVRLINALYHYHLSLCFVHCPSVNNQQWAQPVTAGKMSTGDCGIWLDRNSVSKEFQSRIVLGKQSYWPVLNA